MPGNGKEKTADASPIAPVKNWPDCAHRIVREAFYSGKSGVLAAVIILVVLIRHIDSNDWATIFEKAFDSVFFVVFPWLLWFTTLIVFWALFRLATSQYRQEIDRLSRERTELQQLLLPGKMKDSNYGRNK